jgi:hypothetical protein
VRGAFLGFNRVCETVLDSCVTRRDSGLMMTDVSAGCRDSDGDASISIL